VRRYDQMLGITGLRDDQVGSLYPRTMVAAFVWRSIVRMGLSLPLAVIGTVLNWLPYRVCDVIAARYQHLPDVQASYKVFPAIFLYPLTWSLEAGAAALMLDSAWAAAGVAVAAPVSGWVAALFHQRRERLSHETRAFLLLKSHRRLVTDLRQRRQDLYDRISELVRLYQEVSS
jgi:hypothetical protein